MRSWSRASFSASFRARWLSVGGAARERLITSFEVLSESLNEPAAVMCSAWVEKRGAIAGFKLTAAINVDNFGAATLRDVLANGKCIKLSKQLASDVCWLDGWNCAIDILVKMRRTPSRGVVACADSWL